MTLRPELLLPRPSALRLNLALRGLRLHWLRRSVPQDLDEDGREGLDMEGEDDMFDDDEDDAFEEDDEQAHA